MPLIHAYVHPAVAPHPAIIYINYALLSSRRHPATSVSAALCFLSIFAYTTAPPLKAAAICRKPWRIEVAAGWKSRVSRGVLVCQCPENSAFDSCPSCAVVNHVAQVQLTPRSTPASRFLPFRRSQLKSCGQSALHAVAHSKCMQKKSTRA